MPNERGMRIPYLIQRVRRYGNNLRKGIDSQFQFDYMGSAEFEFGALPDALKKMRASKDEIILEKIKANKFVAYYVGNKEGLEIAQKIFQDQLEQSTISTMRFKEPLLLADSYGKEPRFGCDGWWAIDAELPWAFFKNEADARVWKRLVYEADQTSN